MTITKVATLSAKEAVFERGLQRRRGDPDGAGLVGGRLTGLGILGCRLRVVGRLVLGVDVALHLRVGLAIGGIERVLADPLGDREREIYDRRCAANAEAMVQRIGARRWTSHIPSEWVRPPRPG